MKHIQLAELINVLKTVRSHPGAKQGCTVSPFHFDIHVDIHDSSHALSERRLSHTVPLANSVTAKTPPCVRLLSTLIHADVLTLF